MLDKPVVSEFSHVKPEDTAFVGEGLRDFFLYRDLGIAAATGGRVLAQLVKANQPPGRGTGWHIHEADFHIVLMLRGWARFMSRGQGDAGRGRRLCAPASRHHSLLVRLLRGHGIPGGRGPGRLQVDRCRGALPCSCPDTLEARLNGIRRAGKDSSRAAPSSGARSPRTVVVGLSARPHFEVGPTDARSSPSFRSAWPTALPPRRPGPTRLAVAYHARRGAGLSIGDGYFIDPLLGRIRPGMIAVSRDALAPTPLGLQVVLPHEAAKPFAVYGHALLGGGRPHTSVAVALEFVAHRIDPGEKSSSSRQGRDIIEGGARQAHQLAPSADGDAAGPVTTEVVALLGRGACFNAPFSSSISSACRPTSRSRAAILASYSWSKSAACTSSSRAPASNLPTQIRISCREMSCRLRQAVQRLAGNELLGDLPLERGAVRSVLRHGFHPPEARQGGSNPIAQSVHPQGRTPPFCAPMTLSRINYKPDRFSNRRRRAEPRRLGSIQPALTGLRCR